MTAMVESPRSVDVEEDVEKPPAGVDELAPAWYNLKGLYRTEYCVCSGRSKYVRNGTFGAVSVRGASATKVIKHGTDQESGETIVDYSAIREMCVYRFLSNSPPQVVKPTEPPVVTLDQGLVIKMNRACCSLLEYMVDHVQHPRVTVHYVLWSLLVASGLVYVRRSCRGICRGICLLPFSAAAISFHRGPAFIDYQRVLQRWRIRSNIMGRTLSRRWR